MDLLRLKPLTSLTRRSTRSPLPWRPEASNSFRLEGGGPSPPLKLSGRRETQERARFPMLTKIRERAADTLLQQEFLCADPNFRSLAEAIACAIFISQGKRLQYVNHAAEIITGHAREELLSMNFWDLVHPDCRELVLKRGGARHGGARRYELKILTKNGDERWLDISTAMIEFDGMLARMVSVFDLT